MSGHSLLWATFKLPSKFRHDFRMLLFWRDPSAHRPLTTDVDVLWSCSRVTEYLGWGKPTWVPGQFLASAASFLIRKASGHSESRNPSHRSLQALSLWVRCLSSVLCCWLCLPLLEPVPSQAVHVCLLLLIPLLDQELLLAGHLICVCRVSPVFPKIFTDSVLPRSLPYVVSNLLPCLPSSSLVSTGDGRKGGKEGLGVFLWHPPCKVASRWVRHFLQVSGKSASSELK